MFVILGGNDVKWKLVDYMLGRYVQFIEAVRPNKVKIAGILRRKDLCPVIVAEYNIYLSDRLGEHFKSNRIIKNYDFHDRATCHFKKNGQGYRHMAAMILSVFDEFVTKW